MGKGLWIATGIVVGVVVNLLVTHFASTSNAAPQGADSNNGPMILGTGGSVDNRNDICWVLSKVKPVKGPERTVLALYKAEDGGKHFNLADVRMIDGDLRLMDLQKEKHGALSVEKVIQALPKDEKEAILPPPEKPTKP